MGSRRGFTLIELLVYLGMSGIIVLVMSKFMVDVSQNAARNRASLEVQTNARLVVNRIAQNVRTATTLPVPSGSTLPVQTPSGTVTYAWNGTAVTENGIELTSDKVNVTNLTFTPTGSRITMSVTIETLSGVSIDVPAQNLTTALIPRSSLY